MLLLCWVRLGALIPGWGMAQIEVVLAVHQNYGLVERKVTPDSQQWSSPGVNYTVNFISGQPVKPLLLPVVGMCPLWM